MWLYNKIFSEFKKIYKTYYKLDWWKWVVILFPILSCVCIIAYSILNLLQVELPRWVVFVALGALIPWALVLINLDRKGVFRKDHDEFDNEYVKEVVKILNNYNLFSSDGILILLEAAKQDDVAYPNKAWLSAGFIALMLAGEVEISPMKLFDSFSCYELKILRILAAVLMIFATISYLWGYITSLKLKNTKNDFIFVLSYINSEVYQKRLNQLNNNSDRNSIKKKSNKKNTASKKRKN